MPVFTFLHGALGALRWQYSHILPGHYRRSATEVFSRQQYLHSIPACLLQLNVFYKNGYFAIKALW